MASTSTSAVSAALRKAGLNAQRHGGTGNVLEVTGDGAVGVAVTVYSELLGSLRDQPADTIAHHSGRARQLASAAREALITAGYSCVDLDGLACTGYPDGAEGWRFDVTRRPAHA